MNVASDLGPLGSVPRAVRTAARMVASLSPRWSMVPSTTGLRTVIERQRGLPMDLVVYDELASATMMLQSRKHRLGFKALYSAHNLESDIEYPYHSMPFIRQAFAKRDRQAIRSLEEHIVRQADGIIAVSEEEARAFGKLSPGVPVLIVPNYSSATEIPVPAWGDRKGIVLAGSFSWPPNRAGLFWFVREVLPRLDRALSPITVISNRLSARDQDVLVKIGIEVQINVSNVSEELVKHRVAVVPVLMGAGSRVRIAEALSARLSVVATTKGADGQPDSVKARIAIADEPANFAQLIAQCHTGEGPGFPVSSGWLDHLDDVTNFVCSI